MLALNLRGDENMSDHARAFGGLPILQVYITFRVLYEAPKGDTAWTELYENGAIRRHRRIISFKGPYFHW
jgi:hypothetical protein